MTDIRESELRGPTEIMPYGEWLREFDGTLYARHSATEMNLQHRLQGSSNPSLSPSGIEQAGRLAEELAKLPHRPEIVFSSAMARAHETAQILANGLGVSEIESLSDINEYGFGDWEGKTIDELQQMQEHNDWLRNPLASTPPNGENMLSFLRRINSGARKILGSEDASQRLVVSHATSIRAFRFLALLAKNGVTNLDDPRVVGFGGEFFFVKQPDGAESFIGLPHGLVKITDELEVR